MRYRKKPVVIEAVQFNGTNDPTYEAAAPPAPAVAGTEAVREAVVKVVCRRCLPLVEKALLAARPADGVAR